MFNKICQRLICSKPFTTKYPSKIYCSHTCGRASILRRAGARFKEKILKHFGNKCAHCGFTDERALQIDHVYGGGTMQRNKFKKSTSRTHYYRTVLKEISSGKYQVLCANCNWIKRHTNSER